MGGVDIFLWDEVNTWPPWVLDALCKETILVRTQPASTVRCESCAEEHWEVPELVDVPVQAPPKAYIWCPATGRQRINLNRLICWRIDLDGLVDFLGRQLGCVRIPRPLVNGRLWSLRTVEVAGQAHEAFVVRGLTWPDAPTVVLGHDALARVTSSLIFTFHADASDAPFPGGVAISLPEVLTFSANTYALDDQRIAELLHASRTPMGAKENIFRRRGDMWQIAYGGDEVYLKHQKGFVYIAYLLGHPGKLISVEELSTLNGTATGFAANALVPEMGRGQFSEQGMRVSRRGDAGPHLDVTAINAYRERQRELLAELSRKENAGVSPHQDKIESELRAIDRELSGGTGLGGRPRRTMQVDDRVRKAVSNAISRAISAIEAAHPSLGQHVTSSLRQGSSTVYAPESPTRWEF